MTDNNTRKVALDAILERVHIEGHEDYDGFARRSAKWFSERDRHEIEKEEFISELRSETDFFRYNQITDKENFLEAVFSDVIDILGVAPSSFPKQVYVEDIDSFERVSEVDSSNLSITLPLETSESQVKESLRDIIGEPFEQKDWPGERNDLFTSQILLNSERVDAALMLKGPSVGSEMYMSDAGSRGDQVQRLFESPANLYVVQFNGKIEDRMVQHVKEQAQVTNAEFYCIIDGTDTARLLKAYDKLELGK